MQNKQQEYLKQREKLKYVTQHNITRKVLDPDLMIEQLISDKETFKFNLEPSLPYTVPKWLKVENNLVPAVYEQVWQAVKRGPSFLFCDTQIVTHLFTTSGLSLEKLGYLWSLTNVSSPGILTQQELYIMLALIALVQTGYHVHDVVIINSINHPIVPQLDYSFLRITVANPAMNRSVKNSEVKTNSIMPNGITCPTVSSSVPLHPKILEQPSKTTYTFSNPSVLVESPKNNLSLNTTPNPRQTDIDVTFAIPEQNKVDVDLNFGSKLLVPELDVDFPISSNIIESKLTTPKLKVDSEIVELKKSNINVWSKDSSSINCNFLFTSTATNNLEPRSLDLPVFNEVNTSPDEDEFSEFQSASLTTVDEYSDFQSASPIANYELDNLVDEKAKNTNCSEISGFMKPESVKSDFSSEEPLFHKTSLEADKYDVFRALMESSNEEKTESAVEGSCNEDDDDDDDDDDDIEDDDEAFGEFYGVDVKQNDERPALTIKDKCLEACIRLLREGLNIFSSITNEQTIEEVLSDERGWKYFSQLKIIYDTSQRFQRQFESTHLNDAIYSTWAKLSKYTKYISNEDLLDEISVEDDVDATPCKLCETKCDVNCVRYAGHNYHVTCINLFLHFVEDSEITAILNI